MNNLSKVNAINEFLSIDASLPNEQEINKYGFLEGITDNYELGYYVATHFFNIVKEKILLSSYIDYERLGKEISSCEIGLFTNEGYIFIKSNNTILRLIQ